MRSKFILMLAVLMGAVTTLLFYQYTKSLTIEKTVTAKTVEVVVAKENINTNEKITAQKLEMVQVPEKAVLPQSLKNIADAEGKIATSQIVKGEQVLSQYLVAEQAENVYVSRKVREGYRAVSIGVNFNQSVSNLIEPEDLVDVVFTANRQNNQAPVSKLLLQNVRVLAVGRQMLTPDQSKEKYVEYSSVTVELTPQDAVELVNATQQGNVQLILNKRPVMNE